MAKEKEGFLLYKNIIHTVNKLDDEKAGKLFKHILMYVNDKNPTTDDIVLELVFEPIKQSLKSDLKKYRDTCSKNRENINKRWNKKDTTVYDGIQPNTNDTDIGIDIGLEIDKEIDKEKNITPISPLLPKGSLGKDGGLKLFHNELGLCRTKAHFKNYVNTLKESSYKKEKIINEINMIPASDIIADRIAVIKNIDDFIEANNIEKIYQGMENSEWD